jgi:thiol-disulfide isomerase/thioredoxin
LDRVIDPKVVYADWCGPCKAIAPIYEQLSASLSRPNLITFVKVNVDTQKEIAAKYAVTAYVLPSCGLGFN